MVWTDELVREMRDYYAEQEREERIEEEKRKLKQLVAAIYASRPTRDETDGDYDSNETEGESAGETEGETEGGIEVGAAESDSESEKEEPAQFVLKSDNHPGKFELYDEHVHCPSKDRYLLQGKHRDVFLIPKRTATGGSYQGYIYSGATYMEITKTKTGVQHRPDCSMGQGQEYEYYKVKEISAGDYQDKLDGREPPYSVL